ncbi:MAG TPA: oligosaccharide flippase family protein [Terracidiphilus sp.]|nr:oligosaccharide flippase family protein [Terracidiphilus sp.]
MNLSQIKELFRPGRGRPESAEAHSRERYRRAALTGTTAALGRVVSLGTSILTVRLTFRYLGAERYGMWMTITSVVMMFVFADLGMNNGLINIIADATGKEDARTARQATASAFWLLSAIAIVIAAGGVLAYPHVNTSRLFNVHAPLAMRESGPALLAFFFCFVLNVPLGIVRGTRTGLQNAYINNLWNMLGSLSSLGALLVAIHVHAGLPMLVLSLSGPPVVVTILNGMELFGWSHSELCPNPRDFSRPVASRLLRIGLMFFLMQVSMSVGMQTDNVVIAQILGAKAVAAYAVPARLFNIIVSFITMLSGSMWPAYADAMARHDGPWIRRTFRRVTVAGTSITLGATILSVVLGNRILALWVGPQMQASMMLLTIFGLQCLVFSYLQPINFLLNGIGELKSQVVCAIAMAVVNLGLSILFVKHYGIVGAVLGTFVAQLTVQVIPLTVIARMQLKKLGRISSEPSPAGVTLPK